MSRRRLTAPAERPASPVGLLLPYQRTFADDAARFKMGLMARQTGKSYVTSFEAVRDCLQRKTTWVCLSAGERQALEWMRKAQEHALSFKVAMAGYVEDRETPEALLKTAEISWPNGSRLIAIPANPDTARGYSANLVLDEFAFHEHPDRIWRAIYPSISNPLRGQYKLRIVSTPNGLGNKFADLWHKDNGYAKHKVTIYDTAADGLAVDMEELRGGLDDPEGWAQEYECQFLDASAVLLSYDLIAGCESTEATTVIDQEWWQTARQKQVFIGWDYARKRDLSVPWVFEKVGDSLISRELQEFRGMSTPDQIEAMDSRIRAAKRVCVDYTGAGIGLGDELVRRHSEWNPKEHKFGKIELVNFTQTLKLELFPPLRVAFEKRAVRIPSNRTIREDLHAMQRVTTANGSVTYRAPNTDDGHADRTVALALALRAAGTGSDGCITEPEKIYTAARVAIHRPFKPRCLARCDFRAGMS